MWPLQPSLDGNGADNVNIDDGDVVQRVAGDDGDVGDVFQIEADDVGGVGYVGDVGECSNSDWRWKGTSRHWRCRKALARR